MRNSAMLMDPRTNIGFYLYTVNIRFLSRSRVSLVCLQNRT